ncbi:two-component system, OmpR family, sensor kinase [Methylomagnum ishizawai]|uniref:histidine kinase n=1 Tax=Methylomagnum ishizawai TaxID=1760988 RepID=A0A1Y6CXD9_9GAMM|nr:ATP-binding protein [Methylomagnum ishizawai]SMF95021.1 two-component system, OmpR family, sensor kinase [Methylomagnum ishizawai]
MNLSIRHRLLLGLLPILALAGVAFAVPTWLNVHEEIDELFDKVLRETAYSRADAAPPSAVLPPSIPPADADGIDLVSQAWRADGTLLYRSHPFPPLAYPAQAGFATLDWRGEPWRVFTLKTADGWVQIAQAVGERRETANEVALHLLTPLLALLPALALLVGFGLERGLRPLRNLVAAVEQRRPEALEPIPDRSLPTEIGTLVAALNGLLRRLDETLAAQRQFTADAAHELRTPLTALSLQAQVAERATDPRKKSAALAALREGIARASHLVGQLLTLARLDPEAAQTALLPLRLDTLARDCVADRVPLAADRGIDLGMTGADSACVVGDGEALRILLGNLLDNAIRHTPTGGRVDVGVVVDNHGVLLEVGDTGPGIPEAERTRVFDRFYRSPGNAGPGSGLGLAIVKRIADRHGAAVSLAEGEGGCGLKASVRFPKRSP